jgi:hypothetical protein
VAPLMVRALSMYKMTPGESLDGMVLAHEAPHDTEVAQCIKDATTVDDSGGTPRCSRTRVSLIW